MVLWPTAGTGTVDVAGADAGTGAGAGSGNGAADVRTSGSVGKGAAVGNGAAGKVTTSGTGTGATAGMTVATGAGPGTAVVEAARVLAFSDASNSMAIGQAGQCLCNRSSVEVPAGWLARQGADKTKPCPPTSLFTSKR